MKPHPCVHSLLLIALALGPAGCGDGGPTAPTGPFDLMFTGDASFQAPHGGQKIYALLQGSDGIAIAYDTATVSATQDPSFSFTFPAALQRDASYQLLYWIDSNFGSGSGGVCDPKDTDHQWRIAIDDVSDDVRIADSHRPGSTESVCDAFAFDLSFSGDASFQGAHGGQTLTAAVVSARSGTPVALATASTTVSATADPTFSLTFPGILTLGQDYELRYWIDSNFGGGTEGVCDSKDIDHQWRMDLGEAEGDVSVSDQHRPSETQDVCSTFALDLTFTGDASFQAPHGGQTIRVAVVDEGIGKIVARDSAVVSSTSDPAFSLDFSGVLVRGVSYHLDYWIDSNFGGGTEGVCDPPANDHQWRIEFGPVDASVTLADSHRPSETQSVCTTFE